MAKAGVATGQTSLMEKWLPDDCRGQNVPTCAVRLRWAERLGFFHRYRCALPVQHPTPRI